MKREQSVKLGSPTFIGLLLAQFTATFNDQATHMVAVFFASDMLIRYVGTKSFDEKAAPAIVALCFMLPFFLFSPLAGRLADRFSKRSIIVAWKLAEVAFMLLALAALAIPALAGSPGPSPALAVMAGLMMIAAVFLMGLHSTFFVPAKYGIMPELLHTSVLSRGNGFLEGTSFMAQIFGTSAGGIVYALCKSEIHGRDGQQVLDPGREWIVGLLLVGLAAIGTATAFLMKPVPPAAPDRPVTWTWLGPLRENLTILVRARPLLLALIGVTFVAFMTVFLRQTLLYDAELRAKPEIVERIVMERPESIETSHRLSLRERLNEALREPELKVSLLIALVGFGVGLGSLAAGYFSGDRVELGLVPIGSLAMIGSALPMGWFLDSTVGLVAILFVLGMSAGFVVVPLYTQMQHRAPRERKGNVIAAANFVYVCGGIASILLFYIAAFILEQMFGPSLTLGDVRANRELLPQFLAELDRQVLVPRILVVLTGGFTVLMTITLWIRQPDFPLRTAIWLQRMWRSGIAVPELEDLPLTDPLVLRVRCGSLLETLYLMASVDGSTKFVIVEPPGQRGDRFLRWLARRCGWRILPDNASDSQWSRMERKGALSLGRGHVLGLAVLNSADPAARDRAEAILTRWQAQTGAAVFDVSPLS